MTTPGDLDWLLGNMVATVERVRHAVLLSGDGLPMAASPGMRPDEIDRLAALASGVQSLARGAGQELAGGEVRQTVIEMDLALLFIVAAGHGACLTVVTDIEADAGQVAYEMAILVKRVGVHMVANPR